MVQLQIETQRMLVRGYAANDVKVLHDILGNAGAMKNYEPAYNLEKASNFLSEFCIGKRGAVYSPNPLMV